VSDLFDFTPKQLRYAVFGNPISHSKSPRVHGLFAEQFGISLEYSAVQVDTGGFDQAVSGFQAGGGLGLNVTVPFKSNAWKLADQLTERAQLAEAVNTLSLDGQIAGDNTDGIGLVRDIEQNIGRAISGAHVLLIGAGGAACGVVGPLLDCQPAKLTVVNRTVDRAVELEKRFQHLGAICGGGLDLATGSQYDIVINSASTGLSGDLPAVSPTVFNDVRIAYDLMYSATSTGFQMWAGSNGAQTTSDGLGMLVEQAAESFFIWHGKRPETGIVIDIIRKEM